MTAPTDLGSGGGGGTAGNSPGGAGGGAIRLITSGTLTVNGTVTANGANGTPNYGGGGSGGSIYLTAGTFAGSGSITANGGNGTFSGGGGGGRVAVYYSSSNTFSGTDTATVGSAGSGGTNGTVIAVDSTNNDLFINNTQSWDANPTLEGSSFTYRNVTIGNSATLTLNGYYTTGTNGRGFTFNVTNFTVSTGATVNLAGGYAGAPNSSSSATGPGAGTTGDAGGGGGYGGIGGTWSLGTGGSTYGSATAPVDLGSGGGGGTTGGDGGGAGGGAIKIVAAGTTTVSGTLQANGVNGTPNYGGGGSGGSIYITTATLTGGGTLMAKGGGGTFSGAGGGGRIAIYYTTTNSWTGTTLDASHAAPTGSGGNAGGNGTVLVFFSHYALAQARKVIMSSSAPGATGVSYEVVFTPTIATTIGGIVVDICDNDPIFNDASCTYPAGFSWGTTPSLTVNGGMGSGWAATGVQGAAGTGAAQVLELTNSTPQSVSTATPIDFTITTTTNPTAANHSFFVRVVTFGTSSNMTSEYTISGTTRSGALPGAVDHGGMALSTGNGIGVSFVVPEAITFCVSGSAIGSNCSGTVSPNLTIGHGTPKVLTSSAVDTTNAFTQLSTNASDGIVVRIRSSRGAGGDVFVPGAGGTTYRRSIVIDNTTSASTLTNYQLAVSLDTASLISAGTMRSDCGDIRVDDSDGSAINNYWVENCNSAATKLWVKVPSIPAASLKTIYLRYGSSSLTSLSSTTNTFIDDISGAKGVWHFDETSGSTAADTSGSGLTLTATGTTIVAGMFGNARSYAGAGNYMAATATTSVDVPASGSFSLFAWVKTTTDGKAIFEAQNSTPLIYMEVGATTAGGTAHKLVIYLRDNSGNADLPISGSTTIDDGNWHFVGFTANVSGGSRAVTLYVDGHSDGTSTWGSTGAITISGGGGITVGGIGSSFNFNGIIDEAQYYNQALSSSVVGDLYNSYGYSTTNDSGHVLVRSLPFTEPLQTTNNCGGLSLDGGVTCAIPAVNTSCSGGCSASAISAGTAGFGLCVLAGSANTAAIAPYNGASCGSGVNYGLDDVTATSVRSAFGSPLFSGTGPLNQEGDTLTFAATISNLTPAGIYTGQYTLVATGTF